MGSHVYRSFAVEEARKSGWVGFSTTKTREDMWKAHYERGDNPADEIAKALPNYFTHGEVSWMSGRTDEDGPTRIGLLVAKVSFEKLPEVGRLEIDRTYGRVFIWPFNFDATKQPMLVEPEAGGRWSIFTPTPEGTKPADTPGDSEAHKAAYRKAVKDVYATKERATAPIRNRSDGDSPVKRVWAIAEAMPGANRSEVVSACVAAGINKNTAGTQYFHWKKSKSATT